MGELEYDHQAIENRVRRLWEDHDIYRFDRSATGPVFSVDTPPPYVSASHLHVGHAMSYSQPDFVVRYKRMRGERIFYPMGFDDNGLPTERYVEKASGIKAAEMPRSQFAELCLAETSKTAARYQDLWRRVGLSVDWSLLYSTIDPRCQQTAQSSFVKLYRAGHLRRVEDPILWCPECRTALAQADVEDLRRTGKIHEIAFTAAADGSPLVIATSRPELLPACVALYFHPSDARYQSLAGTEAIVPIFGHRVPIKTDESVDPDFGTGLMMVCTFGDSEDVLKWRNDGLPLRLAVTAEGRMNELAGRFAGRPLNEARSAIVKALREDGALRATTSTKQVVGVHERCSTPVEFQIRPQWFIAVKEHRDQFRARAAELRWIPAHMKRRLDDWIDGLKWDWNISRQRHYGVPFPVWFCASCAKPVLAETSALPVDPLVTAPPVSACPACGHGELVPDPDVMDTWMTSSLSPQINDGWALNDFQPDPALAPMSMRVQAFEIIRTWLFYTVVQSEFHFGRLPWETVMISGWGLNEQGKKISKRDLEQSADASGFNRYVPDNIIDKYGADALRLWATKARIGADLRYNEKDVRAGRKFSVKLWNVGRFLRMNGADSAAAAAPAERTMVDRWLLAHLAKTVTEATAAFEEYDFMQAHLITSKFFWAIYCDRYIEMIKDRFLVPDEHGENDRESARATLHESYRTVIGLFAPFAPFITEEMYQTFYRDHETTVSLHQTAWPTAPDSWATGTTTCDQLATILDAVRVQRSKHSLGASARLAKLVIESTEDQRHLVTEIAEPLRVAARAEQVAFGTADVDAGVDGVRIGVVL